MRNSKFIQSMIVFIVVILSSLLSSSCDGPKCWPYVIYIKNTGSEAFYVYSETAKVGSAELTVQRAIDRINNNKKNENVVFIKPGEIVGSGSVFLESYDYSLYEQRLMFFKESTLKNNSKEEIVKNNLCDKLIICPYTELFLVESEGFKLGSPKDYNEINLDAD